MIEKGNKFLTEVRYPDMPFDSIAEYPCHYDEDESYGMENPGASDMLGG